jgi:arylsulfatase A-like enzyme
LISVLLRRTRDHEIPNPKDVNNLKLIDNDDGTLYAFKTNVELWHFKYQRYMKCYLRMIQSIDVSVGRLLDYLDVNGLTDDTIVIYTSDQGFFLGNHGWLDKRLMCEDSFEMQFMICYPREILAGTIPNEIISNVDFAQLFLILLPWKSPLRCRAILCERR